MIGADVFTANFVPSQVPKVEPFHQVKSIARIP
jgi:hypothetical protein